MEQFQVILVTKLAGRDHALAEANNLLNELYNQSESSSGRVHGNA